MKRVAVEEEVAEAGRRDKPYAPLSDADVVQEYAAPSLRP
jgi:hypothetical protein